jgi:hypothetical protein
MRKRVIAGVLVIVALHVAVGYLVYRATEPERAAAPRLRPEGPAPVLSGASRERGGDEGLGENGVGAPRLRPDGPTLGVSGAPVPDSLEGQELLTRETAERVPVEAREPARPGVRPRGGVAERQ